MAILPKSGKPTASQVVDWAKWMAKIIKVSILTVGMGSNVGICLTIYFNVIGISERGQCQRYG